LGKESLNTSIFFIIRLRREEFIPFIDFFLIIYNLGAKLRIIVLEFIDFSLKFLNYFKEFGSFYRDRGVINGKKYYYFYIEYYLII
jgi:hypothetical protein